MDGIQVEFTCKCGKQKAWIAVGQTTEHCPSCGRTYHGIQRKGMWGITEIIGEENHGPTEEYLQQRGKDEQ